eukprot:2867415-Rhodomonas_salina.1
MSEFVIAYGATRLRRARPEPPHCPPTRRGRPDPTPNSPDPSPPYTLLPTPSYPLSTPYILHPPSTCAPRTPHPAAPLRNRRITLLAH